MSDINITINGQNCKAKEGEFVLNIARANDIFIPAICYLTNCSPTLACRLCMVEADGKRVYACNAKAKDGMSVITSTKEIEDERRSIMEVYDVNHPLQCGVCDQSGECELQDYTHALKVDRQNYHIKDTQRPIKDWGVIHYDASLCIVCERCVTVCKDMIGSQNLKTVPRGGEALDKSLKETMPKDTFAMWNKMQKSIIDMVDQDSCDECGECSAVCPVGALVASDFQYKSNAWELKKIPASNPHSSDCSLIYYEVKRRALEDEKQRIYRVSSDFHFAPLNGAARFGFDFENEATSKDEKSFNKLIKLFKDGVVKQIKFNSFITNEEALILQKLKEKFGVNLLNDEAKRYQKFLSSFASISGTSVYNGDLTTLRKSDFIVSLGAFLRSDSPNASYALNNALKVNKAAGLYFHPLGDKVVDGYSKSFKTMQNRVGTNAEVLYLILDKFAKKEELPQDLSSFLDSLHVTKEKTVKVSYKEEIKELVKDENGEEKEVTKSVTKQKDEIQKFESTKLYELLGVEDLEDDLTKLLAKKESFFLVAGEDLYFDENSTLLAKLLGLIQKHTPFKVLLIPPRTNSLGVSLICDLGEDNKEFTLGYNEKGEFSLSALGGGDLDMPALNQQEGTFTNMDRRVVPTNAALKHHGYCLNDVANALGLSEKYTIDYTPKLPQTKGYKKENFDDLPNHYTKAGEQMRGYLLDFVEAKVEPFDALLENSKLKEAEDMIYRANPINQFSPFTNRASQLSSVCTLHVSEEFLQKRGLSDKTPIVLEDETNKKLSIGVTVDKHLNGDIAYLPDFDTKVDVSGFFQKSRFATMKLKGATDE